MEILKIEPKDEPIDKDKLVDEHELQFFKRKLLMQYVEEFDELVNHMQDISPMTFGRLATVPRRLAIRQMKKYRQRPKK